MELFRQFAKLTNGYFFPLLSSSVCKLYKVNKRSLSLCPSLCWNWFRMKLLLCVSSWGRKKVSSTFSMFSIKRIQRSGGSKVNLANLFKPFSFYILKCSASPITHPTQRDFFRWNLERNNCWNLSSGQIISHVVKFVQYLRLYFFKALFRFAHIWHIRDEM